MDYNTKETKTISFVMYTVDFLLGKVHGITVTESNLAYNGSLTIDETIIEAAGLMEYQKVLVVNNKNGERLETYLIRGQRDSGVCCLNGAAAYKGSTGDELIVMAFGYIDEYIARNYKPKRVFINAKNKIDRVEKD
ncbi:MAG: aspartate 1-decarboxylase [Sediminibacterium sp.]